MPYTNFQSCANPTEFRPHTCYILPSGHPKLITWSRSMRELFTFLCSEIGKYRLPTPCCSSCDLIHSRSEFLMMCFRLHYLFQMFCYPWKYCCSCVTWTVHNNLQPTSSLCLLSVYMGSKYNEKTKLRYKNGFHYPHPWTEPLPSTHYNPLAGVQGCSQVCKSGMLLSAYMDILPSKYTPPP